MRMSRLRVALCAGWIALCIGAVHAGASTSEPWATAPTDGYGFQKTNTVETRNFELPTMPALPGFGFDKGDQKDRGGCGQWCDHNGDQKDHQSDDHKSGCGQWCDHNGDQKHHHNGDHKDHHGDDHKSDRCGDWCDHHDGDHKDHHGDDHK